MIISKRPTKEQLVTGLIIGIIMVAVITIAYLTTKTSVTISLTQETPVGAVAYLSNDKYQTKYTLPATVKLRAGQYQIYAYTPSATTFHQTFNVSFATKKTVVVDLKTDTTGDIDTNPSLDSVTQPTYYSLLPHTEDDFGIEATWAVKDNSLNLTGLTITPYASLIPGQSLSDVRKQRDDYVKEAKDWLTKNGIPDTVSIQINSTW